MIKLLLSLDQLNLNFFIMKHFFLSIVIILGCSVMSCSDGGGDVEKHIAEHHETDHSHDQLSSPTANAATDIMTYNFTANWSTVSGANEYDIDVSTDANFSSPVVHHHGIGGTSTSISGLNGNTEYFYRVKALNNGTNSSAFSNTISVLTLLGPPTATAASDITSSSFKANWNPVNGISDYLLFVSEVTSPTEFIPGYDGKEVTGTSAEVEGLDNNTIYYYFLKAKDGSNVSEESNKIGVIMSL